MIGDLISAGVKLFAGHQTQKAQEESNRIAMENAAVNRKMQQEFAENSIRWKVEDARRAGIHPLYALGANTVSFSPVSVGHVPETGLASGVASMGQDISRALHATRTGPERASAVLDTAQQLQLENAGLQNELLRTQIMKMKSQVGPALPDLDTKKDGITTTEETRGLQMWEGQPVVTTPRKEATQDAVSKEYGDEGLAQVPGNIRIARDWMQSNGYTFTPAGLAKAVSDGWISWNSSLAQELIGLWHGKRFGRR